MILVYLLSIIYYLLFAPMYAGALTMSNNNYLLQSNLDSTTSTLNNSTYRLESSVGQNSPDAAKSQNYSLAPAPEPKSAALPIVPFSFGISETAIDFGTLSPTNPVSRQHAITIQTGSAFGFTLYGSSNQPLTNIQNAIIPNTTCDNGQCNSDNSSVWTSTLAYGFGYRCENKKNISCGRGFSKQSYFKHIPNISSQEDSVVILESALPFYALEAILTYKLNVSGTQPQGNYENTITYIAVPNY